uniref:FPL domain-containing protein n=1 Tax=Schistocephalus solidus TaxID=70667 RepID=A0A183T211_SCHSO
LEGLVAEQIDHLHYLGDIFSLGIPDLTDVLFLILLQRLLLPLYVYSLTKRHPPAAVSDAPSSLFALLLYPSFFLEQNALELLIDFVTKEKDPNISVQLLQTFNIFFENLSNQRALYYLLSQNHVNKIILQDYDFENEEVIGYYIALLKSLSFRVDEDTINFFYDEAEKRFPLYVCALRFFNHSESMVRAAVRTITLNIFKIRHVPSSFFVYAYTAVPYFSQLTDEMRRTALAINDCICLVYNHVNYGRLEGLVAEQIDHLHYLGDIFSLGIPDLTDVLFLILLQRLLLPLYVYSLTKRHPPAAVSDAPEGRSYFFHAVALFLLSQVFTILHQPELIRALTEAILVGDLALLCPPGPTDSGSTENVVLQLRAAHHGRNAAKTSPAGSRLANFVRTAAECNSFIRCVIVSASLQASIAKAAEEICNYSNVTAAHGKSPKSTLPAHLDGVPSTSENDSELPTANGPEDTTGTENPSVPAAHCVHDQEEIETEEAPVDVQSTTPTSTFVLTGKPFLRAIFRSLEVGPGTDYDTLYALNLLIALRMNGCQDEPTLRLAEIGTPSPESPCNPMLITKLLDIIIDASKPEASFCFLFPPCLPGSGSRVRVVTLNLALFLLFLLTRDASNICQLSEDQRTQLNSALVKSRSVLQDFYMVGADHCTLLPNEVDFLDIFEHEVSRYRRLKLHPSTLLENPALLLCHAADAIKLSSNRSQENIRDAASAAGAAPPAGTAFRTSLSLDAALYYLLPSSELEHIQRSVAVFLCLYGYIFTYAPPALETGDAVTSATGSVGDCIQPDASCLPRHCVLPPDLANIPSMCLLGNLPLLAKNTVGVGDSINTGMFVVVVFFSVSAQPRHIRDNAALKSWLGGLFPHKIAELPGLTNSRPQQLILDAIVWKLVGVIPERLISVAFIRALRRLKEKRYLIVTDSQLLLVEPSPKPIGWGSVTFAGLLQETEIKLVPSDSRCLSAVVYRPGDRAAALLARNDANDFQALRNPGLKPHLLHPLMTARLRFQTSMPCSTICNLITMRCERIRSAKVVQLSR